MKSLVLLMGLIFRSLYLNAQGFAQIAVGASYGPDLASGIYALNLRTRAYQTNYQVIIK